MQNSPSTPATPTTLGPFTTLHGDAGDELPPGDGTVPVLALSSSDATWWIGATAAKATLVDVGNVKGARWLAGGKRLRVGFGTLDLDAKAFAVEPALRAFVKETSRLVGIAWFADGARVALLLGPQALRTDKPIPHGYDRTKHELVIVTLASSDAPVRRTINIEGTPTVTASEDRVVVTGNQTMLFDAAGQPLAWPANMPEMPRRASFGAGGLAIVGSSGVVTLVDPHTAAPIATWSTPAGTVAAATFPHGVASVNLDGTVRVACVSGHTITQVAEAHVGKVASSVQVLGDRLVVSADEPDPIRVAKLPAVCH